MLRATIGPWRPDTSPLGVDRSIGCISRLFSSIHHGERRTQSRDRRKSTLKATIIRHLQHERPQKATTRYKPLAIVGTGPPSPLMMRLGAPISRTRAPHPALQQRRAALYPADEPHMECRVGQRSCSPGKRPEAQHIDRWDRSGCGFEVRSHRWHSPAPAARPRSTT